MADKHTPGPWIVVYRPTGNGSSQWRVHDKEYNPISSSDVGPHAFNEANARLIASAPELLKALEVALRTPTCPFCGRDNSEYVGCTADACPGVAAIKAAKGDA